MTTELESSELGRFAMLLGDAPLPATAWTQPGIVIAPPTIVAIQVVVGPSTSGLTDLCAKISADAGKLTRWIGKLPVRRNFESARPKPYSIEVAVRERP